MKAIVGLIVGLVFVGGVATALAFGDSDVTTGVAAAAAEAMTGSGEPAAMLLSGSALLGLAGAVKRFSF